MKKHKIESKAARPLKDMPVSSALFVLTESVILSLILEMLSRRSFTSAFVFVVQKPLLFIFNIFIIIVTLCIAMLFKKKVFTIALTTALWLGFGIANCVVLGFRTASPLTAVDLQLGMEAILMMNIYFETWQIILIIVLALAVIAGLVWLAIRSPKFHRNLQNEIISLLICSVMLLGYGNALFASDNMISKNLRPSLYDSYLAYGFPYCFCFSFFDVGISKPEGYSDKEVASISEVMDYAIDIEEKESKKESNFFDDFIESVRSGAFDDEPEGYTVEAVDAIRQMLTANKVKSVENLPNIVFVQLESFFDPYIIESLRYSADPIPNFRRISQEFTSGELYVPTVAGGTANTEFEVLTGMSLDYFGAGEFPFYSILKEKACESLATDLRALDYMATAIHNYTGSFYYRHIVYDNIGFNRFVPLEYMGEYETTVKDWPKDKILTGVIVDALKSTQERDFVYTVAVQTHGRYIELPEGTPATIRVDGAESESQKLQMEYFLNQLFEVDQFIGDLTKALEALDEDVIVVFFGDHLPGLSFDISDLRTQSVYTTEYVIWSNMPLEKKDMDLEAYQLGAYALQQIDIDMGVMIKFHQSQMAESDYLRDLEILEYDMLYGDRFIYKGMELKSSDTLQMGIWPVRVTNLEMRYDNLFIHGENFTPSSVASINGTKQDSTVYVSENLLILPQITPEDGDLLTIVQYSFDNVALGISEAFECMGLKPEEYED